MQRELVRVEPGEVEQVGDEAFEPAGLRRDHVGGADAGVLALDGAVGDRLGVAADRRQRRAQVVRHAEQERALVPAGDVEVGGHRVDRLRQAGQLVVVDVGRCRPRAERSPPAMRAGGGLHGRERAGHAARQVGGDERGDPERDGGGAEHRQAAAAEGPGVHVFGEHQHRCDRTDRRQRLGRRTRCCRRARSGSSPRAAPWCRGRRPSPRRAGSASHAAAAEQAAERLLRRRRSRRSATTAPFEARRVVLTRSRIRRSWRRPATVPVAACGSRQLPDELVELGCDDLGAVLHVVARGR